jgi:hypothetical protein
LPSEDFVFVEVYSVIGEKVATLINGKKMAAGSYEVEFTAEGGTTSGGNASGLSSGVYIYRLTGSHFSQSKKMVLLR